MPLPISASGVSQRLFMKRRDPISLDPDRLMEPQIISYEAPVCPAHNTRTFTGSSSSPCGFTALNFILLAEKLAAEGIEETTEEDELFRRVVSQVMIDDVTRTRKELTADTHLSIAEVLRIPIFQETFSYSSITFNEVPDISSFESTLSTCLADETKMFESIILSQSGETLVCFRISVKRFNVYALFDSHSRSGHTDGPACILSTSLNDIAITSRDIFSDARAKIDSVDYDPYRHLEFYFIEPKHGGHRIDTKEPSSKSAEYLSSYLMPSLIFEHPVPRTHRKSHFRSDADIALPEVRIQLHNAPSPSGPSTTKTGSIAPQSVRRQSEFGWQMALQKLEPMHPNDFQSKADHDFLHVPPLPDLHNKENLPPPLPAKIYSCPLNTLELNRKDIDANNEAELSNSQGSAVEKQSGSSLPATKEAKKKYPGLHSESNTGSESSASTSQFDGSLDAALASQLQKEEEISMFSSRRREYRDYMWLVALQNTPSPSTSDLDLQLALQLQQESSSAGSTEGTNTPTRSSDFPTLQLPPPTENFECGVCAEVYDVTTRITLSDCGHMFCKNCLTAYAMSKIDDSRYPIFCPECVVERPRAIKTQLSENVIQQLDLPQESLTRLQELQLVLHCITLQCPRCREVMNVDRAQFTEQNVLVCPLPRCGHKWCKSCLKTLPSSQHQHKCKNGNIDRLMKRKGWKYCPGCRTPVQKETGCNHMTCGTPGCNVHFCYKCGVLMVDTTHGGDVGTAVTEHYMDCQLFEKKWKCTIQ